MMHRLILTGILLLIFPMHVSCAGNKTGAGEPGDRADVPREYQALYEELAASLNRLDRDLNTQWDGNRRAVKFGAELLVANSNRGEILLSDRVLKGTVITLDRFKDLGAKSVAVSIQFPLLTPTFPRFDEYKAFYRRVAQEIRRREFVFIVEIGTFFKETEFTKLRADYSHMTFDGFGAQLREMTGIVIRELQPDYLTILTEPDTMQNNTGLVITPENFSGIVRQVVQGLDPQGVKLGSGAGTWSPMPYFNSLATIPGLDYIDIHVYPVQRDYVWDKVARITDIAARQGKRVAIGEAWLYKVSRSELGRISPVKAFARDLFSFWQPLDSQFVEVMAKTAHHVDAEFCSFFWMKHFYAYLDYDSRTRTLSPQQLINEMDRVAGQQIYNNRLNKTGEVFKSLSTGR